MKLQELIQNPLYKKKFVLEKLLSHYLNKTREELWMDAEQDIPEDILNMFLELHDGRIIKIEEQNSDCIITIISEEDV